MDKSIYAGAFTILNSLCDMKIDFYELEPICDADGHVIETQKNLGQRVTLSYPLAKDLVKIMTKNIEDYEKECGKIIDLSEA